MVKLVRKLIIRCWVFPYRDINRGSTWEKEAFSVNKEFKEPGKSVQA